MRLKFVGIDPDTNGHHCVTVWADMEDLELLIQGWEADAQRRAACGVRGREPCERPVPNGEVIIRIPARMVPILRRACDAIERAAVR